MYVTVKEATEITGLSERTIRQWMADDKIEWSRLGDGKGAPVRIRKRSLLALFKPGNRASPA